jgi:hypothetical protein
MSAKVFISHSSKDDEAAKTICTALENRALPCWIASRNVGPGENFQEAIVKAIRSAKVMVLVFTESANNSNEIKKELALASRYNLVVIPVRVENVVPSEAFELEFATRQWVDLFKDWEREIERLSSWIAGILAIEPGAAATRPAALVVHPTPAPPAEPPLRQEHSVTSATTVPSLILSSKNPLHHFAGAFLLILSAYLLVILTMYFWAIKMPAEGIRSGNNLFVVAFSSLATGWRVVISFIVVAATMAAGLGTTWQQNWGRYLGLGLCIIGLASTFYLTYGNARAGFCKDFECFVTPAPPTFESFMTGAVISLLFAVGFIAAGAVYIRGWQARLVPDPNKPRKAKLIALAHRTAVFATCVVALCALTLGAFDIYRPRLNYRGLPWLDAMSSHDDGRLLWLAALIAIETVVFAWCLVHFHKEFGPAGGKVIPVSIPP